MTATRTIRVILGVGLVCGLVGWSAQPAEAQCFTFFSAPAPVYVAPAPVYVAPAPVYVAPATTYVAPVTTYVAPAPVVYYPPVRYVSAYVGCGPRPYPYCRPVYGGRSWGFGFHYRHH